jgi:ATP-binding cassette subfamily B protein
MRQPSASTRSRPKPVLVEWVEKAQTQVTDLLNPETLLPGSHREPTTLIHQQASPWQRVATGVSENKKTVARQQEHITQDDWQVYGRYLVKYWRPYWPLAVVSMGLGMSFSFYRIAFATTLKVIFDSIATIKVRAVLIILLKFIAALPVVFALTIFGELLAKRIASRTTNDMRYDMFAHAQELSLDYYKRNKQGDLLSRFSVDMSHVENGMGTSFADMSSKSASILAYMIALFILEWHLALFVLLFMPASVYLLRRCMPKVAASNRKLRQSEGSALSVLQEGLSAQPIIQSFGIRQFIQDAYWQELRHLERDNIDAGFQRSVFQNYSLSSIYLLDVSSMGLGVLFVVAGIIPLGTLLVFQTLIATMRRDITFVTRDMNKMIQSAAALGRVDQLLKIPADIIDGQNARELPIFSEGICFEDVSFSYTGNEYQLSSINLSIKVGQFVAFVGPSGAGKSTVFNLLMRFYDVSSGRVTIDGHDVRALTQASLRAQMGVVLQETFIFNTSILNNIRVVRPEATEAEVANAAKAAELHHFIMSLPEGYATNAGEGGGKLSGGQKQRIAIARAMLCNPDILLLDEATSSLDADTAAAINATIHDLARSRTVIAITHHLASVANADKIYVLDQGRLVEEGNHASLLAQENVYAQLWRTQTNGAFSPPRSSTISENIPN